MPSISQILFIELLGGMGDVVIALPAIHALARSYPWAKITVLTFAPGAELLLSDRTIHQVKTAPTGAAKTAVEQILSEQNFDLIVSDTSYDGIAELLHQSTAAQVVTNLWQSPPPNEFVGDRFLKLLLADQIITPESIGFSIPESFSVASSPQHHSNLQTHSPSHLQFHPSFHSESKLGQIHLTETEKVNARQILGAAYRPLVFLCPDAGMAIKRWSPESWIQLGKALQQQYQATCVIPVGSEIAQAEQIVNAIGTGAKLWPRGALRGLAAAIAQSNLLIAADTGVARIAAALNIPTITLFGPSWWGRYGQPAPHLNLQGFPDCPERNIDNFTEQACWYSGQCPFEWNTCLDDISPDEVMQAIATSGFLRSPQKPPESPAIESPGSSFAIAPQSANASQPTEPSNPRLIQPKSNQSFSSWIQSRPKAKLLLLRLDNIGDVIMTSPALRALRSHFPTAHLTLMASPAGALAAPLLPWIDEVLPYRTLWQDLGNLAFDPTREWQLIQTLQQHQFDAALIFTSFSQSPHPPALLCALAGIPLRVGESKETDLGTLTHAISPLPETIHQVDRNLGLLEGLGLKVSDRHLSIQIPSDIHQQIQQALPFPYLLLNPWTSCPSRNYPADRFAQAALELSQHTGWPVVLTGVVGDRDRAVRLMDILGDRALNWVGKTNLIELAALVDQAQLVITNNTSTMHLADATQTPNVILFAGTEHQSQWIPRHSSSIVLNRSTLCSPCYSFTCSHQLECLDIAPEAIVEAGINLIYPFQ
jgi:ADP-heptose:LPS heptosyltransferase